MSCIFSFEVSFICSECFSFTISGLFSPYLSPKRPSMFYTLVNNYDIIFYVHILAQFITIKVFHLHPVLMVLYRCILFSIYLMFTPFINFRLEFSLHGVLEFATGFCVTKLLICCFAAAMLLNDIGM